jgi:hypothetical protein
MTPFIIGLILFIGIHNLSIVVPAGCDTEEKCG